MEKEIITFTERVQVEDHNGNVIFQADKGDVVKLPPHSAQHWVKRNKAKLGGALKSPTTKKAAPKKKAVKE